MRHLCRADVCLQLNSSSFHTFAKATWGQARGCGAQISRADENAVKTDGKSLPFACSVTNFRGGFEKHDFIISLGRPEMHIIIVSHYDLYFMSVNVIAIIFNVVIVTTSHILLCHKTHICFSHHCRHYVSTVKVFKKLQCKNDLLERNIYFEPTLIVVCYL